MARKKLIYAYTIGNQWHVSIETNEEGVYYGIDLHYTIKTKKAVKEWCKENYPNHKVKF